MSTAYDALGHEQDEDDDRSDDLLDARRLLIAAGRYFELEKQTVSRWTDEREEQYQYRAEALDAFATELARVIDARIARRLGR